MDPFDVTPHYPSDEAGNNTDVFGTLSRNRQNMNRGFYCNDGDDYDVPTQGVGEGNTHASASFWMNHPLIGNVRDPVHMNQEAGRPKFPEVTPCDESLNVPQEISYPNPKTPKPTKKRQENGKESSRGGGRIFPERLMAMLSWCEREWHHMEQRPIAWVPHGKSFRIVQPRAFASVILPKFFKECKFKSFTRRLYRWGFRQITTGPDRYSFFHQLFQRDNPSLCGLMSCRYSDKEQRDRFINKKSSGTAKSPEKKSGQKKATGGPSPQAAFSGGPDVCERSALPNKPFEHPGASLNEPPRWSSYCDKEAANVQSKFCGPDESASFDTALSPSLPPSTREEPHWDEINNVSNAAWESKSTVRSHLLSSLFNPSDSHVKSLMESPLL